MTNAEAVERMETALRDAGRLEAFDEPLIVACLLLAGQVDAEPDEKVWREYRLALKALREATSHGPDPDEFGRLLAELSTPVGDASDIEPPKSRGRARSDRGEVGDAVDAVAMPRRRRRVGNQS